MAWGFGDDGDNRDNGSSFHFSSANTDSAKSNSSYGFQTESNFYSSCAGESSSSSPSSPSSFYGSNTESSFYKPVESSGFGAKEQTSFLQRPEDNIFSIKDSAFGSSSKGWGMGGSGFLNDHARNELSWVHGRDTGAFSNTAAQLERHHAWSALEDQHRSNCWFNQRSSSGSDWAFSKPKPSLSSTALSTPENKSASSDNFNPFAPSPLKKWGS